MLSDDNDLVPGPVAQNPNATRNSLALTLADEMVIKCEKKTARTFRGSTGSNNAMMIGGRPSCRPATLASGLSGLMACEAYWNSRPTTVLEK
jgi:hypothetical protein